MKKKELIWSDEFEGNTLNLKKWSCEIGNGKEGWGNWELQYYTNRTENIYIKDNILHIKAIKENYKYCKYTSARITTRHNFQFKYGTVEANISLPLNKGIWPAFWMLGNYSENWPNCGEIDILESKNLESKIYSNCHWYSNGVASYGKVSEFIDVTKFHIYKLDWDKEYIRIYIDDKLNYEILIKDNVGNTNAFHSYFDLMFNVAVGGNFPGNDIDDSGLPKEMLVDYVRVYQNEGEKNYIINENIYNYNN